MSIRLLTALVLMFAGLAAANPETSKPMQLLLDMQNAMTSLNYEGTLAILKNAQLDTLQYFHAAQKGKEQERLLSLNSPLREIVRDNDKVSCLFKVSQQVLIDHKPTEHSFLMDLPKAPNELEKVYELTTKEEAHVALQAVDVLALMPKDQYRYARKFWIAKQSHLPLKIEVQNFTGETLEQVIFTDLRVVAALHRIEFDLNGKEVHHIHQFENLGLDKLPLKINNVPAGFEKRLFTRTHLHPSNKAVDQLLLSDGLSSVSVYLEKNPQNFHPGLQTAGAVNALSRIVNDVAITVMGDVPAATVEFIAEGISLDSPAP